jgi:hypothetical protein
MLCQAGLPHASSNGDHLLAVLRESLTLAKHRAAAAAFVGLGKSCSAVATLDLDLLEPVRAADRAFAKGMSRLVILYEFTVLAERSTIIPSVIDCAGLKHIGAMNG